MTKLYVLSAIALTLLFYGCNDNGKDNVTPKEKDKFIDRVYKCDSNNSIDLVGCWKVDQCTRSFIGVGKVQTYTQAAISFQNSGYLVERISRYANSDCTGDEIENNDFTAKQFNKDYTIKNNSVLNDGVSATKLNIVFTDASESFVVFNIINNRLCFMTGVVNIQPGISSLQLPINTETDIINEVDYIKCYVAQE